MTTQRNIDLGLRVFTNARLFAPEDMGIVDLVVANDRIAAIGNNLAGALPNDIKRVDLSGKNVVPGFIDNHCHILGGGGANGYKSRVPELHLSHFTRSGITTVVGMLGLDSDTKHVDTVLAHARTLTLEGMSAYVLSGSTPRHPIPTLTGSPGRDLFLIPEVLGVGEVSISELGYGFDSMGRGADYIAEVAADLWAVSMLTGKAGVLCLQIPPHAHVAMQPLIDLVAKSNFPKEQFLPSHVNQSELYLEQACEWGATGGFVDIGANYLPSLGFRRAFEIPETVEKLLHSGVPSNLIMISSDGGGRIRLADEDGIDRGAQFMSPSRMLTAFKALIAAGHSWSDVSSWFSSVPARFLRLHHKGTLKVGADADFLVFSESVDLELVVAKGRDMVRVDKPLIRGTSEQYLLDTLTP